MISLIEKENNSNDKWLKPDFNQKSGRELFAFYLQTKFKQILAYDRKCDTPIFIETKSDFISRFSKRLISNPQKKVMIGITGESACGKSTICKQMRKTIKTLDLPVSVISADFYFNDISELISKYSTFDNLIANGYDIDSPDSFQLDLLKSDLDKISNGEDIFIPKYKQDGTGISIPNAVEIPSRKIVVVEGMSTMYRNVKDVFDIKVYIETTDELREKRFLDRASDRNQSIENARKHWDYVKEAGRKYVQPSRKEADIIINGNADLTYFSQIIEYIYTITNNFQ
ncbi:MAG: hypothetical protein MJ229_03730 [bacterium]|nr:hypothetical protein [bacterium]